MDGSNALHRIRIIGKILNGLYLLSYNPQFETQYNMEQHKKLKNFIKTTIREFYNEQKDVNHIDFATFLKNVTLSYPQVGYDKDGDALVDITLKTKPNSDFKYKYVAKGVKIDDYISTRKRLLPIQIKEKIYNDFYLKQ